MAATLTVLAVELDDGSWAWTASTSTPGERGRPRIIASHLAARSTQIVFSQLLRTAHGHCITATPAEQLAD